MKCPIDGEQLVMSDRNGVEIDYCPSCRGVWLDRGELDKIIERSVPSSSSGQQSASNDYRHGDAHRNGQPHKQHKPYKKRESFLSELFDF